MAESDNLLARLLSERRDDPAAGPPEQPPAVPLNRLLSLADGARTVGRHANSYLGLADYLMGRMPSTAAGLVNSAIPYQPFGGVPEAHAASQNALDDFRSLYP